MTHFFDPWQPDEIDRLAETIMWIQDAVGGHFPWCDALLTDAPLSCSCGMDAMRVNRAFLVAERVRRAETDDAGSTGDRAAAGRGEP